MVENEIIVYEWKGIYGFFPYIPRIANLRQLPKDDEAKIATDWIYNFKSKGKGSDKVKEMVGYLAEKLQCNKIIAIPPSSIESQPNALQKIYGNHIWRIEDTETRKWKHEKEIPEGYENSFIISGVTRDDKILFVDDICTSGKTLNYYLDFFHGKGITAVSACLGFHYKLKYKEAKNIEPVKQYVKADIKQNEEHPESFKSCEEAAEYLSGLGYKITWRTMYNHWKKKGYIQPDMGDRGFSYDRVMKYAINRLKKKATLKKDKEEGFADQLQKEELRGKETKRKLDELKLLKEEGKVVEKALIYQQFASLTVGLENAAKGQAQIDADDAYELIVNAENGPAQFVEIFNDILDRALNEMAKMSNIQVVFGEEV